MSVIVQSFLSNNCDLFLKIIEVFNEMEMEININNKSFKKFYLKIGVGGKEIS